MSAYSYQNESGAPGHHIRAAEPVFQALAVRAALGKRNHGRAAQVPGGARRRTSLGVINTSSS